MNQDKKAKIQLLMKQLKAMDEGGNCRGIKYQKPGRAYTQS